MTTERLRHGVIGALGLVTICCYGSWYYAFGVLLDPILVDTRWRESMVAAGFSGSIALIGVGAVAGGRLLDRWGPRQVFVLAAVAGGGGLLVASAADSVLVFAVGGAVGGGALGALAFYHVTMATAVRTHPGAGDRAIAVLTIWGAFASPIYLPVTAALVDGYGWRSTLRILAATSVVSLVVAAIVVPSTPPADSGPPPSFRAVLARSVASGEPRRFTISLALIGISISVVLAYQVPVMIAAGLSASAAAAAAGFRGFAQLGGRLPLGLVVGRLGVRRALLVSFASLAAGSSLLAVAGQLWVAILFAVIVGYGIGSYSPLQGMYTARLFDSGTLGATMGFYSSVGQLAGAVGPLAAGVVAEASGDRRWVVPIAVVCATAGLAVMLVSSPERLAREQRGVPRPTG